MVDNQLQLNTIEEAVADIKAGKLIIVVDDEDRENEGDFIAAAELITPETINFMSKHGRGLICTPIEESKADALDLPLMVNKNTALHETAFTVSIDLIGDGCTTGISAYDRATCVKALSDDKYGGKDFARPGHIFPLRAKAGGVLRRPGHTEAAVDLAKLAGLKPVGVLIEILNEDGSMARLPQLRKIAQKFDLKIISIKDLVAYRMEHERLIKPMKTWNVESPFGALEITSFKQLTTDDVHFAIKVGDWKEDEPVMVRVHSAPRPDELLTSLFDRRNKRFFEAMEAIAEAGKGLMLYMRHGDKGRPIEEWLERMATGGQDIKPKMDKKDFGVGAQILRSMKVRDIILISSKTRHWVALEGYGLKIVGYHALT
ncbi:MAG TPA: 3,4-dihydroxy-2-butanone-4-phosphate synthase [Saprospiraceae bacterium]|nr:3,4-dihydroxy-2-butanone-4-phosphate synthase [Saprospiraceae bacterium]